MRFVEEKYQLWLFRIADFRQPLEQLGKQPKQKRRVKFRRVDQFVGTENIDHAAAVAGGLNQILQIERGLGEKFITALFFQSQQAALDRAYARSGHVTVLSLELCRIVADVLQHRSQVFQIEQQHAVVIGNFENHREHAALSLVKIEQASHQQRPHFRDRRAHRVSLVTVEIPKNRGVSRRTENRR